MNLYVWRRDNGDNFGHGLQYNIQIHLIPQFFLDLFRQRIQLKSWSKPFWLISIFSYFSAILFWINPYHRINSVLRFHLLCESHSVQWIMYLYIPFTDLQYFHSTLRLGSISVIPSLSQICLRSLNRNFTFFGMRLKM